MGRLAGTKGNIKDKSNDIYNERERIWIGRDTERGKGRGELY